MSSTAALAEPVATENSLAKPALSRVGGIDVLRGLSIIAVVIHHITLRIPLGKTAIGKPLPTWIINDLSWNGYYGVIVFFAISGFLITTTCFRRWASLDHVRLPQFYRMRFARIAPMLLALLIVLSLLQLLHVPMFTINPQRASLPRALVAALTFHVNWLEAHRGYLPANWDVLWSLSNEEMFYLFFPLVCVLTRSRLKLICVLFGFVLLGPPARTVMTHNRLWAEYGYLSSMDAIAIGCLAAIFCDSFTLGPSARRTVKIAGAGLVGFAMLFRDAVQSLGLRDAGVDVTLLACGTALMLVSFTQAMELGSRYTAPLRWFGRNSYEVYLTHMMAIFGLLPLVVRLDPVGWLAPIWYAAMVGLAGLLGALVARYFSEPMNRKLRARKILAQSQAA
ncbi:MAG TPA: acyltransferase [Terriglobales bacterium]|nr:acyltransferase [Terriglobales bacterium]